MMNIQRPIFVYNSLKQESNSILHLVKKKKLTKM